MSFDKLKEAELRAAAAMFAVEYDDTVSPAGKFNAKLAAAALAEEGVTWDIYQGELERLREIEEAAEAARLAKIEEERLAEERLANTVRAQVRQDDEVEPEEDVVMTTRRRKRPASNDILVKMDRQNSYYEVGGKVFTRDHPFVLLSEDEAQAIFDTEWGFRVATPREAAEYYS